jgi:hypothetical protein
VISALATLKPRARRHLPEDGRIVAAYACLYKGDEAVLAFTRQDVFLVANPGWFWISAPRRDASAKSLYGPNCVLLIHGETLKVAFHSASDAQSAMVAFGQSTLRLGPDDRIVSRCVFLGGANVTVSAEAEVDLLFRSAELEVHRPPAVHGVEPIIRLPYAGQFEVELSGPGRFTTGGGFVGGGFGLMGAAEGMALAGVLNALTTRTQVLSVIAVMSTEYEAFFLSRELAPDELRRRLAPVFLRSRQINGGRPAAGELRESRAGTPDLVAALESLAALHRAGALTDEEFQRAKGRVLAGG